MFKPVAVITCSCLAITALAWLVLTALHVHINNTDAFIAAIIGASSGTFGLLPILKNKHRDPVTVLQMAMIGTVLHLVLQFVLAGAFVAAHVVALHGSFIFWLLGEYWISLVALIWQLRRLILCAIPVAKVQN